MSGLEPLAALGLACNILQIVEVGHQTITLIKAVYQNRTPDNTLKENAEILKDISEQVKTCTNIPTAVKSQRERQLLKAADNCSKAARELQEEVSFLLGTAKKGNLMSALKVAAKTNWRKRRLDRLKETLDNTESLMQTGLLQQVWSKINVMQLNLDGLGSGLQRFIAQWSNNQRTTQELVSREALITRQQASSGTAKSQQQLQLHVTREAAKAQQQVESHVTREFGQLSLTTADATKRERLLLSLKYSGFNARRNEVHEADSGTFRWIFSGDEDDSYSSTDMSWDSFSNWLKSTSPGYWISGKPGSGKSTLVNYILSDSKTQQCLHVWDPTAVIISHFFWKPGSDMQRNLKGLLCSLIFQLLSSDARVLGLILSHLPDCDFKDSDTDWSLKELRSVYMQIMDLYESSICIFLDGLDEFVDPNNTLTDIFGLLKRLSRTGKVKLCVASRPEPQIRNSLQSWPQLRLQDLTRTDLVLYARERVKNSKSNTIEGSYLISLLVDKAEGVFLWLVLAVRNINRGLERDDNSNLLRERIDSLPEDLTPLYHEMWKRATEQDPVEYRQRASLYLQIVLTSIRKTNLFMETTVGMHEFLYDLNVFNMLLVSDSSITYQLLGRKDDNSFLPKPVPADILLQACERLEQEVEIYSGGLIELHHSSKSLLLDMTSWEGDEYNVLLPFAGVQSTFGLIHRTAYDFLTDTAEGQEILSYNPLSETDILIRYLMASLAKCRLFFSSQSENVVHNSVDMHLLSLHVLAKVRVHPKELDQLNLVCKRLCTGRRLFAGLFHSYQRLCIGLDFVLLTSAYLFNDFPLSVTEQLDLDLLKRSDILSNALCGAEPWNLKVEPWLRLGVDLNRKGACYDPHSLNHSWTYLESPSTACFKVCLFRAITPLVKESPRKLLKIALKLLSHGADLQATLGFVLVYDPYGYHMEPWSALGRLLLWSPKNETKKEEIGFVFMPIYAVVEVPWRDILPPLPESNDDVDNNFISSLQQAAEASFGDDRYGLIFLNRNREDGNHETLGYRELPLAENPRAIIRRLLLAVKANRHVTTDISSILEAANQRSIEGDGPFYRRLEELGLATRDVGDVRSREEWLSEVRGGGLCATS